MVFGTSDFKDFDDWRKSYQDGTRILWHDRFANNIWLHGTVTGMQLLRKEPALLFKVDGDNIRMRPRMLTFDNRDLMKKE